MFILSEAGTCLTIRCGRWLCVRLQRPTAETVDFGVYLSGPLKVLFFEPRSTIHQFALMARVAFLGVLTLTTPSRGSWQHRHPDAITVAPARPIRHRPPFAAARICMERGVHTDRREEPQRPHANRLIPTNVTFYQHADKTLESSAFPSTPSGSIYHGTTRVTGPPGCIAHRSKMTRQQPSCLGADIFAPSTPRPYWDGLTNRKEPHDKAHSRFGHRCR